MFNLFLFLYNKYYLRCIAIRCNVILFDLIVLIEPKVSQHYVVPAPPPDSSADSRLARAVHSMWQHFTDVCSLNCSSSSSSCPANRLDNPYSLKNPYTKESRLPVFVQLSKGESLKSYQKRFWLTVMINFIIETIINALFAYYVTFS